MREIELLPDWYHQVRSRKRAVVLQSWLIAILIVGLGAWLFLAERNVRNARTYLDSLGGQINQSNTEKKMLNEQLTLRQELQAREQLIASLGYPVEMTRLLQTLDNMMPKEVSLTDFTCDTEIVARQVTDVSATRASAAGTARQVDRKLKVKLAGVAPSDVDWTNFVGGLTNVKFFDDLAVNFTREKSDAGHVFREFEVTFSMTLNPPAAIYAEAGGN